MVFRYHSLNVWYQTTIKLVSSNIVQWQTMIVLVLFNDK